MATINSLNVPLSGNTGTGNFAGSSGSVFTSPVLGNVTATTIAFNPTTSGVTGTNAIDNTNAGNVGQFIQTFVATASSLSLSSGVILDIMSISLTAGDWDVTASITYTTAASTLITSYSMWTNSVSATKPSLYFVDDAPLGSFAITPGVTIPSYFVPYRRYSLSGTTTIYFSAVSVFSVSTLKVAGVLQARRTR